jgi:hypothetical protein
MRTLLGALYLLLCSAGLAFAQNAPAPEVPLEPAGMTSMIVFFLLFFGTIAGFFVWVWYRHRKGLDE